MCGWKLLPQFTAAQVVSSYHVSLSKGKREREGGRDGSRVWEGIFSLG